MAFCKKTFNGNVYWYLSEKARVDGKPKTVSERYLRSAKDIEKLLDAGASVRTYLSVAALNRVVAPTSKAGFGFPQLKDPRVVSFSPMNHWTAHNLRIRTFTCVLARQIAHLMRREAEQVDTHTALAEIFKLATFAPKKS